MLAGAALVAHVHSGGCVIADKHDGEARRGLAGALAQRHARAQVVEQFVGNAFAVKDPCSHALASEAEDGKYIVIVERSSAMTTPTIELEAAAFRRLLSHLNEKRPDVQNIDLMILAGFCRNCLADWYREAAADCGVEMSKDQARDRIYGEPFADWKAKHQKEATPEQLAAFAQAQARHT